MPGVEQQLRRQAGHCLDMGSPLMHALLTGAADDVAAGGVVAALLEPHAGDPVGSVVALRFAGALHRLVLERRAPELALHYPSVGGTAPVDDVWPAAERTVREHLDELRVLVRRPVQTNEVGRCAGLAGVLALVDRPVRLLEVGASAGLVLHVDRYAYELAGGPVLGDATSPVRLRDPWHGTRPPAVLPPVVDRRGCDPSPLDATSPEGRLTLTSYVWADQRERLDRLRGALAVAERAPVHVDRARAVDWLPRVLAEPVPDGVVTVVWHSVVRQYLPPDERDAVEALLAAADVVHASLEPEELGVHRVFAVRARWRGDDVLLGTCDGHGTPVAWTGNSLDAG